LGIRKFDVMKKAPAQKCIRQFFFIVGGDDDNGGGVSEKCSPGFVYTPPAFKIKAIPRS
jgi:hypothetical protein